ncbi:hypothetical protein FACS1894137_12900 [Spirochaetia bacterium]|nr:hypothetical protein FACS1894137_12900 [Spirochaetia bacterium]
MRKFLVLFGLVAALFLPAGAARVFAEEYKIFCTGDLQGEITVTKDTQGKITIISTGTRGQFSTVNITHGLCPLVPEGKEFSVFDITREIVIDGNTTTRTFSNRSPTKTVVDGNTTTETWSDGWGKTVVEGNTTTGTISSGLLYIDTILGGV